MCNNRVQKGETEGLNASAHAGALLSHAGPDAVDVVVLQSPELPGGVEIDREGLDFLGIELVEADVSSASGLHDEVKLAGLLREIV